VRKGGEIFPLPYIDWRPGQLVLARAVATTIEEGGVLLVRYPTGTGKTLAVLSGSLPTLLNRNLRVFYAVKTLTQFQAPLRELRKIAKMSKQLRAITVVGKQKLCLIRGLRGLSYDEFLRYCAHLSARGECPFATSEHLDKALDNLPRIADPQAVLRVAKATAVCPYRLAMEAVESAVIVVGSYSYLFDPEVRQAFLRDSRLKLDSTVIVVDEAHNLPDYLMSVLSVELRRSWVRRARREAVKVYKGQYKPQLVDALARLETYMSSLERRHGRAPVEVTASDLLEVAPPLKALKEAASYVESVYIARRLPLRTYLRRVLEFFSKLVSIDPRYVIQGMGNGDYKLVRSCVSPSHAVSKVFRDSRAAILMSGTLPPKDLIEYYTGIESERVREISMPNPYASNAVIVGVAEISSRYVERCEETYKYMARAIDAIYRSLGEGILLAVFPSYDFMKRTRLFIHSTPMFMEREGTTLAEVEGVAMRHRKMLILVNAWGKIAEGIELREGGRSRVRGIVVAGLPVPEPTPLRRKMCELLSAFLSSKDRGWEYTYLVPAAMKIVQAVGRGLRAASDRVFVAVLDERLGAESVKAYVEAFGYKVDIVKGLEEVLVSLDKFFGELGNY